MPAAITVDDVAALIRKQLKKKLPADARLEADTELEPIGLSSLDVTEVFFGIEAQIGLELDPTAGAKVKTIGDLVEVVNGLVQQAENGDAPATTPAQVGG